ncbi:MAG: hypothetical protein COS99_03930 [Candidatus Omnitrophica bacterium CG07_land_8_20_14_0_80_42_15]|uniref:PilZ domain-containing protein n=1 Tax=Candidatus Aquitaenariimonas noxiae TaxID=1974741 RepID=A0A2J0KT92_9BACT|nr:MAG: hypothetical protein COS99_03930 [Candidatus Omnitrophica bacterium CG07_land_8_20_14_0_80_42_15]
MKERRRAVRFKASFDIEYTTKGIIEIGSKTKSKDISISGIQFPINRLIKKGTKLKIEINPPHEQTPIVTHGKVVWVKESTDRYNENLDAGIKFSKIDLGEQYKLLKILKNCAASYKKE